MIKRTTVSIILRNNTTIQEGYIVIILKKSKTLKIRNIMIQELSLTDNVIERVEHIMDQEGTTENLEFNDQHNNKINYYEIT